MISSGSVSLLAASPTASGKSISRWVSLVKVVETIKKISSKNTTSIKGVKLMLSSSRDCRRNCTGGLRLFFYFHINPTITVQRVDQLNRLLLHDHHQRVDATLKITVRDHRRNRHTQTSGRGDQRLRNASRQHPSVAGAFDHDRVKHLDHTKHGTQQTQQWANGRDGAQHSDKSLHIVNSFIGGLLDTVFHYLATAARVA